MQRWTWVLGEAGDSIRVLSRSIGDAAEAAQQIAASNR